MSPFYPAIVTALAGNRYRFSDEVKLHQAIAARLTASRLPFEQEVRLSDADRIDFLVAGEIGLEVKIKGRAGEVLAQLRRYAASDRLAELVLFTTRLQLSAMPLDVEGKPLHVIYCPSF